MKPPRKPTRPSAPIRPKEFIPGRRVKYSFIDGTLKDILNEIGDIDTSSVYFDYECNEDYGEGRTHEFSAYWTTNPTKNLNYEEQLKKYNVSRLKYQEDMKIYNSNLKEYKSLEKQYLKWFHTNALEKL